MACDGLPQLLLISYFKVAFHWFGVTIPFLVYYQMIYVNLKSNIM